MQNNRIQIVTKPITGGLTGFGEQIVQAIESLEGRRAIITIEEFRRIRTTQQNAYYWAVVLKMFRQYFEHSGHFMSNDDMHLWIKEYVWRDFVDISVEKVDRDGVVTYVPFRQILTSTLLTTVEWEHRMMLSRAYAAENFNGMQIPEPREKLPDYVQEWLDNPEGVYYEGDYKNYFNIVATHELSDTKQ